MDSKQISAHCFGRKNNDYLRIPNFLHTVMAGRTTIICGFQTIFRLCLWREEQQLFVDSKPISAQRYGRKNNDYLWIPNHFQLVFMAGRTTIICGFQNIFRLCLWREEQRLLVDSKTISAQYFLREQHQFLHTVYAGSQFSAN